MQNADLHFHTTCSDGKHQVSWVAEQLSQLSGSGLRLAVLTDHDGTDGFQAYAKATSHLWPSIRASELSCMIDLEDGREQELHLLVYGIEENDEYLNPIFERFRSERQNRFFEMCKRLSEAGYPVDAKSIAANHPGRLGRPHVADALVNAGHVSTRKEAFDKFLYKGSPFNVAKWRVEIADVLQYTRKKSYKTSIAHPGIYGLQLNHLRSLKEMGLDAVEVFHPRHNQDQTLRYLEYARQLSLNVSGGSDFHDQETDKIGDAPSLGRTSYPWEMAEAFLHDIL